MTGILTYLIRGSDDEATEYLIEREHIMPSVVLSSIQK